MRCWQLCLHWLEWLLYVLKLQCRIHWFKWRIAGVLFLTQDLSMRLSSPLLWHQGSWLDWVWLGGSTRGWAAARGTKRPWGSWSGADCSAGCTVGDGRLWGRCWPALNENLSWLGFAGIRDDAVRSWGVKGKGSLCWESGWGLCPTRLEAHTLQRFSL